MQLEGSGWGYWKGLLWALWLTALTIALFPQIDLFVSGLFYAAGNGFAHDEGFDFIRQTIPWIVAASLVAAAIICRKSVNPQRTFLYVVLCFAIGPGLIVNGILKEYWGRARPVQIEQFGGHASFTSALHFANQCSHNCSFTAGDPSIGFALIAFAFLLPSLRFPLTFLALFVGFGFGFVRIAQGGHFLSDVLFTALITIGSCLLLYRFYLLPPVKRTT